MDTLLQRLKEQFPAAQISTPFIIDEEGANPSLVATWTDFRPLVTPFVDYLILTKKSDRGRWPSILGHISLEALTRALPGRVSTIELEGTTFYVVPELENAELLEVRRLVSPGLPQPKA